MVETQPALGSLALFVGLLTSIGRKHVEAARGLAAAEAVDDYRYHDHHSGNRGDQNDAGGHGGHRAVLAFPCRCASDRLTQNSLDDLAGDIGEAEIAALEAMGQPRVVETEKMKDCSVHVVDVHLVFCGVEAELI